MKVYFMYLWKKFRDAKIRTKLIFYIISVALVCSCSIGGISYITMRKVLINTARRSSTSLMKQKGNRMDDRIREFQDATWTFSNNSSVRELLNETETEISTTSFNEKQAILSENFLTSTVLHNYAEYVIVKTKAENIYFYDQKAQNQKINISESEEIMNVLENQVTATLPVKWIKNQGRLYFVRRIVKQKDHELKTTGTLIFCISDEFLHLEDDGDIYVKEDNMLISGEDGSFYLNNPQLISEKESTYYSSYKDGKYRIYNTVKDIEGKRYLILVLRTTRYRWNMLCFVPYEDILISAKRIIPQIVLTTLVLLAAGLCLGAVLYRNVKKNLNIIELGMQQYENGDYSRLISPAAYDELGMLILQFNHMGMKIHELNELTMKEEAEKQELEYQVMEAQINPHFLYNTLGSLKWLAYEKEEEEIARLADAIINLLRFTVKYANQMILLKEEIQYIDNYVYIQQMRYENTFHVEKEITPEAEEFPIMGFILQPFLENSILHGLDNARTDGVIKISGKVCGNVLQLGVEDNGRGMSPDKLQGLKDKISADKTEKYKGFNGIGVINIILRLKLTYGEEFCYTIESEPGKGTAVWLSIPERRSVDEEKSTDC